jgi:hypothetical protein
VKGTENKIEDQEKEKEKEKRDKEKEEDNYIVETLLLTGEDWKANNCMTSQPRETSPIFIVDLLGHFVVMKPIILRKEKKEETKGKEKKEKKSKPKKKEKTAKAQEKGKDQKIERSLLLVNSTTSDYINRVMVQQVCELWWSSNLTD